MIARRLAELKADHILILAAMDGAITELACAMPDCVCPNGRSYFERRANPLRGKWAPSTDRYPILGRDGGKYVIGNVRLAHWGCNNRAGGLLRVSDGWGRIVEPARRAYYKSEAAREHGRRRADGLHQWHREHPEALIKSGKKLAEWRATHPEASAAASRKQTEWIKAHPEHSAANLRAWKATPAAHEVHVATGRKLATWSDAHPEGRRAGAARANCQRWELNRGWPCACGTHTST